MATRNNRPIPVRATHPGTILLEELKERGISQKEFAKRIGVPAPNLNSFIKGKRDLNKALAMKLEEQLGISFATWMRLQNSYIYDCKAIEERDEETKRAMEYEENCSKLFNIQMLYKFLRLSSLSCSERVSKLKEALSFSLTSASELRSQFAGLYKHSEKVQIDERNMLTWLILNRYMIAQVSCSVPYLKGNALKAASEIARMANGQCLSLTKIKQCLSSYGIAYVEVAKIEKAPVDAYSTMLDGRPVISVTYRYNDLDKRAFDILHELYHIDRHLSEKQMAFIALDGVDYSNDPREREANMFAQQALIPDSVWNKIIRVGSKRLSPHAIVSILAHEATKHGISPSIAVARYKRETGWYRTRLHASPKIH